MKWLQLSAVVVIWGAVGCTKDATPASNDHPAAAPANSAAPTQGQDLAHQTGGKFMQAARDRKDLWATIDTSMGIIVIELDAKDAPIAVENFVGLASGEKAWKTPQGDVAKKPLYDGTIFHRVIPDFMIQGGDPQGTGMGGPGFTIQDDFPRQHGMHFVKGTVGMARTGMPNSGGCQFFIDVGAPSQLDNQYTIFGKVLKGQEVADAIAGVPRGPGDRPTNQVTINMVKISDTKP